MNRHIALLGLRLVLAAFLSLAPLSARADQALGDTIPQFKRGLELIRFVPKGQWITGVNVSYSQSSQDNYQFLIVENLSGKTYSFKVSPMVLYSFADNMAAGGRLSYERSLSKLSTGQVVIDSETDYDVDNLYSLSHNYFATAAFRNYLSMGHSTRFGFFTEVQLKAGGGQSKIVNGSGDDLTGTYERNFQLGLGLTPGLVMFLNNYSAIEVSVGVLGFNYTHTHSVTDRIYVADRKTKSANFKVNLFSITFGVAFYL